MFSSEAVSSFANGKPVFQPIAAGSGIPQIKCFLNGVKIPRVVRLKVQKTLKNTHYVKCVSSYVFKLCVSCADADSQGVWGDLLCGWRSCCREGKDDPVCAHAGLLSVVLLLAHLSCFFYPQSFRKVP